tara:strand:+ start:441 stop:560 length:120 start_codon:yes stop_codon:yes gene_type:complete
MIQLLYKIYSVIYEFILEKIFVKKQKYIDVELGLVVKYD